MVAAVLQHPLTTVMSKGKLIFPRKKGSRRNCIYLNSATGNSPQRATMMRALGANAVLVDQVEGKPGNVRFIISHNSV